MNANETHALGGFRLIDLPELSDWECHLFGSSSTFGITWRPAKGEEPNAFWRWMQFVCFGNRWRKIPQPHHPVLTPGSLL